MSMASPVVTDVVLVMKPVDGGRAVIGIIECPHCGQTHYTTQIDCGQRRVFCGTGHVEPDYDKRIGADGYSHVNVTRIL